PCFLATVTAHPQLYTLSLHDALPIYALEHGLHRVVGVVHATEGRVIERIEADRDAVQAGVLQALRHLRQQYAVGGERDLHVGDVDRKSTRLNSSHVKISYAVFCLNKK